MLRKILLPILLILIGSFSHAEKRVDVSLIRLIATPEKFHGKYVLVRGYLHNQFEDNALYLSKEDADFLTASNAVWVSYNENPTLESRSGGHKTFKGDPKDYFDCRYVVLEGTFNMNSHGHMGAYSGELQNVTRIDERIRWFDGQKRLRE